MKRYVGYSEHAHDAALSIISEEGEVIFASQSERYSHIKHDPIIHNQLWDMYNTDTDHLVFYEEHELNLNKKENHIKFRSDILSKLGARNHEQFPVMNLGYDSCFPHHMSHCASAFFTRPWKSKEDTVMVSIDGYGERTSAIIYDHNFNVLHETEYPKSVGMVYTTATKALGLRPMEDEYVTMGLSSYGDFNSPNVNEVFNWLMKWYGRQPNINPEKCIDAEGEGFKQFHKMKEYLKHQCRKPKFSNEDIAAATQKFAEKRILQIMQKAREYGSKLCYAGGCAQNVVINSKIHKMFDEVHIAIDPTDSGGSLGAAALQWHKETGGEHLIWSPYLGHNIDADINPKDIVDHLLEHKICGVAHGRAEFGPRALGNRSLIADVRYDVKDTVNEIKRRQKYRPFAPAIMEEFADQYFEGPMNEYMQYTSKALHDYKSVTHVDGTARVQIVRKDCSSILRKVLEEYYDRTGVPMLLNTSLNIRGRPMVNNEHDARLFEQHYNVKVFYK